MEEVYREIQGLHAHLPGGEAVEVPPPDHFEWIFWPGGIHRWNLGVDVPATLRLLQLGSSKSDEGVDGFDGTLRVLIDCLGFGLLRIDSSNISILRLIGSNRLNVL